MSSYPFLLAQLPTLSFQEAEFLSLDEFLGQAGRWLSETEYAVLARADLHNCQVMDHGFELLREWTEFRYNLQRDLANFRENHRLGHDHKTHMFPTAYVRDETPLVAEIKLLELQWEFLAERRHVHYDDLTALVIYSLHLQILERKASFDEDTGRERFEQLASIDRLGINLDGYRWQAN
jgi:hypothetical protein